MQSKKLYRGMSLYGTAFIVLALIKLVFPESIDWLIVFVPVFVLVGTYMIGMILLLVGYMYFASNKFNNKMR